MRVSLEEMFAGVEKAAAAARDHCEREHWAEAREIARNLLSHASKLHKRLAVLAELREEANFVAEVDRAIARERAGRLEPIPGDQPLPFPRKRAPRKKKGE